MNLLHDDLDLENLRNYGHENFKNFNTWKKREVEWNSKSKENKFPKLREFF